MIESGRTNAVPKTMIALCIGLFVMRAAAVFYGTCVHQAQVGEIAWQKPKPIDTKSRDLLAKPMLYFFYDSSDQFHTIIAEIYESMLFHNREIANLIEREFTPVKVAMNGEKSDPVAKSLNDGLSVYAYPSIYIALANGQRVQNTTWQSDRMFHAFLADSLDTAKSKAAGAFMMAADWERAVKAYERRNTGAFHGAYSSQWDAICWSFALRHLKNESKAKEVLAAVQGKNQLPKFIAGNEDWPEPCVNYLLGKISKEELKKLASSEGDRYGYKGVLVHYVCGEDLLLKGDKDEAIKELKQAVSDRDSSYNTAANYARGELRCLGVKVPNSKKDVDDDFSY